MDKIKAELKEVAALLEKGKTDIPVIQTALDKAVLAINEIDEGFYANGSELETVARESIGANVDNMLEYYHINIDPEEAIRKRD